MPYLLKCGLAECLSSETLVLLYPLHHALLQPLYYLSTTSLLPTELQLLSVALMNLLLLAESPQAMILKACLWIGGVILFVCCSPILTWNVTLARVPKWKLRHSETDSQERTSLVDAVSELISLQTATSVFTSARHLSLSDADDDEPAISIKQGRNGRLMVNVPRSVSHSIHGHHNSEPPSAISRGDQYMNGAFSDSSPIRYKQRLDSLPPLQPR